ncbi:t-complex protein 1 subunit zeta, partial [Cystoisospora suis]
MQIQHPTASMIARAATAQDESTGDGTTSSVLLIGELLRQSERWVFEGVHPRVLCKGFDKARMKCLEVLDQVKVSISPSSSSSALPDREILQSVARTSLRTKLNPSLADKLTNDVVDAICILASKDNGQDEQAMKMKEEREGGADQHQSPIDLFMVEILHMRQGLASETRLIRGMVMDHGARHPDMPTSLKNCFIFTCNVSLEYEKSEVNSGFFYSSAEEREKMVEAERKFTDDKVRKIIEFKR